MDSLEEPGWLARVLAVGWTLFATFAFVLCLVAGVWSWCGRRPTDQSPNVRTELADPGNVRHEVIRRSLNSVWDAAAQSETRPQLAIAESKELNAASFGNGTFLFWDGVADLPASEIDAIAAHEVAHDHLRHSKKAAELRDVTQFFSQLIGLVGGASDGGQRIVSDWVDLASLPKYSRTQEFQADSLAVEYLGDLGYDHPRELFAETLRALELRYGSAGGGLWDSHPGIQERLKRVASER